MNTLNIDNNKIIAYNQHIATNFDKPTIIFHHGFMSDMSGNKAQHLHDYCKKKDLNFIRYDNYGCGNSSEEFIKQTISSWLNGAQQITTQLTKNQKVIHVGSSLGAWIATLMTINHPENVVGLVNIASAFDFTKKLIWDQLTIKQKEFLRQGNIFYSKGHGKNCSNKYPIHIDLIEDATQHLLLEKQIQIDCPVHLVHGTLDDDVPHSISEEFFFNLTNNDAILKLVKDGDHRMSREKDMRVICNSIDEIISGL
ncbi:MAG: hypothetical protein DGJ47_000201 [Rickettsiaceae bacterium]